MLFYPSFDEVLFTLIFDGGGGGGAVNSVQPPLFVKAIEKVNFYRKKMVCLVKYRQIS